MIANSLNSKVQTGSFSDALQLRETSLNELIEFIAGELPIWRDRPERPPQTSETLLTSQLCAHLNSAARKSDGWDFLQFRPEEGDTKKKGRKVDLVPAPCGETIWIDGRAYEDFDTLLPIECKRLPTPTDRKRDEREYVIHRKGTTGGIQRFKEGLHGAEFRLGVMIGYVQAETASHWHTQVTNWIDECATLLAGWSTNDHLQSHGTAGADLERYNSKHTRTKNLADIELRHLWIDMKDKVATATGQPNSGPSMPCR